MNKKKGMTVNVGLANPERIVHYIQIENCDDIIEELDALEQAIVDICSPDVVREIHERKRMILKK